MARQLPQIIADMRQKIATLASQRDAARSECAGLAQRVETLGRELDECREQLKASRMEIDFLTFASHADNPDNLVSARRRLKRLIAKIDRCVALLKEDADIS